MATAPRPGVVARRKKQRTAITITIEGDTRTLYLGDLGPQDDLIARKQTGFPVSPFVDDERFGADSLAVLWWMARRKNGERRLRFDEVAKDFPGIVELGAMLEDERIVVEVTEEGEGDGDGDVIDVEAGPDPLPSAAS